MNILFVCSRNQWRSPTAERIFSPEPGISVRSGGTLSSARHTVSQADLDWADHLVAMEHKHISHLRSRFGPDLGVEVHVLNIPDDFQYMDTELMTLLREAVEPILGLSEHELQSPDEMDFILEEVSADCFWIPDHVEVVERAEIKYIHSANEELVYNRVLRVRPRPERTKELVEEVLRAHRGRASQWVLTTASGDTHELRETLESLGYEAGVDHHAYTIGTRSYEKAVPEVAVREATTLEDLQLIYRVGAEAFDRPNRQTEEQLQRELAHCTGPTPRIARFIAYRDDEPAGVAGMTFFDDASFALIWAAGVAPEHRGHRVYTALLAERARVAAARGIERMGLYARVETSAPIVAAHGFDRHGSMIFYTRHSGRI